MVTQALNSPAETASWAALAAIGVGAFALVTTEFLPVGLLPQIARNMGGTEGQARLAVTMSGLLAAIAAPVTIGSDLSRLENVRGEFSPTALVYNIGRAITIVIGVVGLIKAVRA